MVKNGKHFSHNQRQVDMGGEGETSFNYVHTKSENEFNLPVEQLNTPPTSFLPFPMRHKFIRGSRYAHPTTMTLWRLDFG